MTYLVTIETRIFMTDAEYDHYVREGVALEPDQRAEFMATGHMMVKRQGSAVTLYRSTRLKDESNSVRMIKN